MRDDTLSANIRLSGEDVESSAVTTNILEMPRSRGTSPWRRYSTAVAGMPLLTLSMLFSSSAPGATRLNTLLLSDSSVLFNRRRPSRRRVTLAQARQFALDALQMAEAARARFAEIEGAYFTDLYEWSGR